MSILKILKGEISVEVQPNKVTITGFGFRYLYKALIKEWNTSRIGDYLFIKLSSMRMEVPHFFLPELVYILKTIRDSGSGWVNRGILEKTIYALETETWLKKVNDPYEPQIDYSQLKQFYKTPLPHQKEFLDLYDKRTQNYRLKGYLFNSAVGSGKTICSLMLANCLHADHVIVVSPKNAIYRVWETTVRTEFRTPQTYWVQADGKPYQDEKYIIVHYESLGKIQDIVRHLKGSTFVILDECHNFNEIKSQRTQSFIEMCSQPSISHVLWMSGTPLKAMGYEIIPLLRTIDRYFDSFVEERFKKVFGNTATRAVDILAHRIGLISHKVEKKEVQTLKPIEREIKVKIPNGEMYTLDYIRSEMQAFISERRLYYFKHKAEYEKFFWDCIDYHKNQLSNSELPEFEQYLSYLNVLIQGYDPLLHKVEPIFCNQYELKKIIPNLPKDWQKEFKSIRSVIKYVELKIAGEALGRVLGRKRAQCHVDMVPHIKLEEIVENAEKKTLIFTSYVEVAKRVDQYFREKQFMPIVVYGETNNNLPALIRDFEKKNELNPAIATYQSLSTAVPMTMANTAIFIDSPFRDHIKTQAKARVDRIGQDTQTYMFDIVLDTGEKPNISTRSKDIMQWSKEQVEALTGVTLGDDESVSTECYTEETE